MSEILKWITTDIIAKITLAGTLAAVVIMYLVAFFQGREISFWPPKIGKKPNKIQDEHVSGEETSKEKNEKTEERSGEHKGVFESDPLKTKHAEQKVRSIEGIWKSNYSGSREGARVHYHQLEFKQSGTHVVGQSLEGSISTHIFQIEGEIRSDDYFIGIWESTDKESTYHGVFQFIINPSGKKMTGKWIGTSFKRTEINSGNWELTKT